MLPRFQRVLEKGRYAGPVPEADIVKAEETLSVRFPLSYRLFLRHFGAAWLRAPYEVAGLSPYRHTDPQPPLWVHVVDHTEIMRRAFRGQMPHAYVPISSDGGDYQFYLDTGKQDAIGESPVVVFGPGLDGVVVATSFVEFAEKAALGDPLHG